MKDAVIGKNRFHEEVEMSIDSLSFRPSVYGIVIRNSDVLLVPATNGYDLPGGGLELGETLRDGLVREIKEETGYAVDVQRFVDCRDSFFTFDGKKNLQCILIYGICTLINEEQVKPVLSEYEKKVIGVQQSEWVSIDSLKHITVNTTVDFREIILKVYRQEY